MNPAVRAPTSCQVRMPSGAQEYELSLAVSLSPPASSQPHLPSAVAPPTVLRSFSIYECILLNPCPSSIVEPGFGPLGLRGHPTLAEVTRTFLLELSVDQFFHQQRKHTLVIELKWLRSTHTTTAHWEGCTISGQRQPEIYRDVYFTCSPNVKPA